MNRLPFTKLSSSTMWIEEVLLISVFENISSSMYRAESSISVCWLAVPHWIRMKLTPLWFSASVIRSLTADNLLRIDQNIHKNYFLSKVNVDFSTDSIDFVQFILFFFHNEDQTWTYDFFRRIDNKLTCSFIDHNCHVKSHSWAVILHYQIVFIKL